MLQWHEWCTEPSIQVLQLQTSILATYNHICNISVCKTENVVQHWGLEGWGPHLSLGRKLGSGDRTALYMPSSKIRVLDKSDSRGCIFRSHRGKLCNVCSEQTLGIFAEEEPLGCAVFIVQVKIDCLVCKAELTLPRYTPIYWVPVTELLCAYTYVQSLRCSDMHHDWRYCHCHKQAARYPKVSLNFWERILLYKSLGRGGFHLQISLPFCCLLSFPAFKIWNSLSPESTSDLLFWSIRFKGLSNIALSSAASSQIYNETDFLSSSEISFNFNFHNISISTVRK